MPQDLYKLPEGWEWKKLINQAPMSRTAVTPVAGETYHYIGLEHIEGGTGNLINFSPVDGSQIASSKTRFTRRMVLYGKLRPYLNKVHVAKFDGVSTTEIIPFVCSEGLIPEYLAKYLGSVYFVNEAVSNCSGTRMPRVTTKFLKEVKIPLPPLAEQERIVEKLDALFRRIDDASARLNQILTHTQALFASALEKRKSTCVEKYPLVPIADVATVARGKSKNRPRNDKILYGGEYPFVQTGDVRNASKYITDYSSTYNEVGLAQSKLWDKGTICLTIAANIGDVAILGIDACFPDSVVGIYSAESCNEFLYYYLTTLQRELDQKANSAAQKNINLRIIQEIEIPLPPLEEQRRIVEHLDGLSERIQKLEAATRARLEHLATLKASLLDAAFRGKI